MKINKGLFLIFFLLIIPISFAEKGHMKLLAVSETDTGYTGKTADLYLDIKPGTGSVFIATFPLSKLDTQMSTRFAKQIACNNIDVDCNKYDFFYTIKADSPIIGGPSAGAAIAILTIARLKDIDIKDDIAITGTINSGGFIGYVSGLKEKIDVAAENGIKKVLIPKGEHILKEGNINLVEYAKKYGIDIIEVSELDDAFSIFTGEKEEEETEREIEVNEDYKKVMKELAEDLCNRSTKYKKNVGYLDEADNLTEKGLQSFDKGRYYSAASFCYSANVVYSKYFLSKKNLTVEEILDKIKYYHSNINKTEEKLKKIKKETITDLEAYTIVKERLINAKDYLTLSQNYLLLGLIEESVDNLANAIERTYSAFMWANFFGKGRKEFELDPESLKKICMEKITEAQERYQYVQIYFPDSLKETDKEISRALEDYENNEYELCLFKASKAKAEADIILNIYGADEEQLSNILEQKLNIVKKSIIRNQDKYFPIVGYSYYEYSQELDKYSALIYSEYALELSNLNIYFKKSEGGISLKLDKGLIWISLTLVSGIIIGFVIGLIFFKTKKIKKSRYKPKRSSRKPKFAKTSQGKKR